MRKRIVCIIDDDKIYQFASSKLLQKHHSDVEVICFDDGLMGLEYLMENDNDPNKIPDVLLLDINMPVMDGWSFLDEMTKIPSPHLDEMTIYIVSSSIDTRDLEKVKEYKSVKDYLVKPLSGDDYKKLFS